MIERTGCVLKFRISNRLAARSSPECSVYVGQRRPCYRICLELLEDRRNLEGKKGIGIKSG